MSTSCPSKADPGVDQISGRFIAADSTVHFGGVRLHVTAGGHKRNLHQQPPSSNIHNSKHITVGWVANDAPKRKKSQHAAPPLPLVFSSPVRLGQGVTKLRNRRVHHPSGGERSPPRQPIPLWARQSSPAALIPAPLAFYPSSFVVANSSMWALHAPAETRRVCGSIQSWFDPLLPSDSESV